MILVDAERTGASRPGKPLFSGLSVTVSSGDRVGVVGLNGSGKSTLLRILAGVDPPEAGVVRRGRNVRVAFLPQRPELRGPAVRDAAGAGWEVEAVLDELGMGGTLEQPVGSLSGGQAKRVALARALVDECELLILDEPTNHLDLDAIAWLEERLAFFRGGLVLVTHDRHLLDRLTTRVLELDRGRGYVHEGGYDAYLEARAGREEQAAAAEATRRNLARAELAWLRRGAPARTRKPKARTEAAKAIVDGRAEGPARAGALDLARFGASRLGTKVVELRGAGHRFDGGPWLFRELDLLLEPGDRIGLVGPNGSGKSTLLDVIAGRRQPVEGHVESGPTVRLGYYDQAGVELDPSQRVRDAVAGPTRVPGPEEAALLERFWFGADAQWAPVGLLSGGERRRLQLLLVLAQRPNVLLLDEPTNDLDLDTLRALEDFLDEWPGVLVAVSHDRAFLERTVVDVLAVDGQGSAALVPGGYAGWEQRRGIRPARRAAAPAGAGRAGERERPRRRSASTLARSLREAEAAVTGLERRRDELSTALAEAAGDHATLARTGRELADVAAELEAAEDRWLELASEAEALRRGE